MLGFLAALPGIMSAAGGAMSLFGKKKNPMNEANQYLNQIPGQAQPYYQPYIDAGKNALNTVQGEYGKLINDPGAMYNKFGEGFKESPGYQFKLKQALDAQGNASARGGMLGTPQDQYQASEVAHGMADQDFNDYMSQIFGMYGKGLEGEQGIENQGYGASTDYANMLSNILGQKGKMAYEGANAANQANAQGWSNIFGGIAGAGQGYMQNKQQQQLLDWLQQHSGGGF